MEAVEEETEEAMVVVAVEEEEETEEATVEVAVVEEIEVDFAEVEEAAAAVELPRKSAFSGINHLPMLIFPLISRYSFSAQTSDTCYRDPNVPFAAPEKSLMDTEDAYIKSATGVGALGNLSLTTSFPNRPGHGTVGKKIAVYANYFKLAVPAELNLTRYNVEVSPEATGRKLRRILQLLFEQPEFVGVSTDFKTLIMSLKPLNIPAGYQIEIPYRGDGEDEPLPKAITYTVRVLGPTPLDVSGLVRWLSARNASAAFPSKEEIITAMNAVLAYHPQLNDGIASVGANRHFSTNRSQQNARNIFPIGGGLESLRGFYQSVRAATGGLLLNVNVTHGIFLQPERLDQLFPKLGSGNKTTLHKKLKLVRVKITHLPPKKSKKTGVEIDRVKTIFGLAQPRDGSKEAHPPQISGTGAGPKGVKFWLSDLPSGEKDKAKPKAKGPALPTNAYVTVFDYFKKSKFGQSYR